MSIYCVGNSVLNEISSKTAQFVKIAETLIQCKADVNRQDIATHDSAIINSPQCVGRSLLTKVQISLIIHGSLTNADPDSNLLTIAYPDSKPLTNADTESNSLTIADPGSKPPKNAAPDSTHLTNADPDSNILKNADLVSNPLTNAAPDSNHLTNADLYLYPLTNADPDSNRIKNADPDSNPLKMRIRVLILF